MQIKVCGITQVEQAMALEAMGVNYIGFIFYSPSKRYALHKLSVEEIALFKPSKALKVGVFVNETLDKVIEIVQKAGLDMVQLHGDEDVAYCTALRQFVKLIKVIRVSSMPPLVKEYEAVADYLLFDTDSALYGGTGNHFNWELLKIAEINTPYFLSGGIGPNDIGGVQVLQRTKVGKNLMALDLNSQFETVPGIKDLEKVKTFIHALI
jgi:phosphoribosylanthranilate isomerase